MLSSMDSNVLSVTPDGAVPASTLKFVDLGSVLLTCGALCITWS